LVTRYCLPPVAMTAYINKNALGTKWWRVPPLDRRKVAHSTVRPDFGQTRIFFRRYGDLEGYGTFQSILGGARVG
jgi:hypothetical protein